MAARARLRRPMLYLALSLALGAAFAWGIPGSVGWLPWTHHSPYFDTLTFPGGAEERAVGFVLAAASVAWCLRLHIASAREWRTLGLAWACVWIGGGAFMFFFLLIGAPSEASQFVANDGLLGGILAMTFMLLIGGPMLGAFCSHLLLPIALPLAWLSVMLLRWASGGTIAPRTAPA